MKQPKTEKQLSRGGPRPGAGAPRQMADGRRIAVYLDSATIDKARELGGGSVSQGIRRAIQTHCTD
jgi:hypothetical protein